MDRATTSTPSRDSRRAPVPRPRTLSCATLVAELEQFGYMANVGFHAFVIPIEEQITGRVTPGVARRLRRGAARAAHRLRERRRLLLVRGEARRRELAVRVALGAGSTSASRGCSSPRARCSRRSAALPESRSPRSRSDCSAPTRPPACLDSPRRPVDWSILAVRIDCCRLHRARDRYAAARAGDASRAGRRAARRWPRFDERSRTSALAAGARRVGDRARCGTRRRRRAS